ncbi:SDR family oxidoreductase [Vibrio sp. CK2-1]|uniref:SDR family oxidoreductase n=1 Tax=Vibrio sp. CK2-1 TaxID=2912249 RepID=UPI001F23FFF6|nr:SDR family oxidoreductase [Vibrio sp. CK2-1]MCF7352922.1 SDR family oxidoreductase [Vibrio sp. CK2-1]
MTKKKCGIKGWTPERIDSLAGKTYLITGANSGAGFEASRILLSKGAKVVMLNRNVEKSNHAIERLKQLLGQQIDVSFVQVDLAEMASVRKAANEILQTVPRIEALICNGAIAQVANQQLTVDGYESQFGVNHLGHFLLCGMLFDRINDSKGRIVVVGSNGYKMGLKKIQFDDINFDDKYSAWNSYSQSKLAQMMFAYELQRRIKKAGKAVQVYVCHPGASRTNLLMDTASSFNKILWSVLSRIIAQSAEKGAWPEVMCATEQGLEEATLYGPTKRADTVGAVGECVLEPLALDERSAKQLWALSEEATSLNWSL